MANYTSVTASNICDAAGNKLASGTVSFQATDASNQPIPFQVGGGGQVVTTPAVVTITNGAIANGFQVADPGSTNPSGILYRIVITDTTLNRVVATYSLVSFTGLTFNLDNYVQSGLAVIPPAGGNVNGSLTVGGNLSVTGAITGGAMQADRLQLRGGEPWVDVRAFGAKCDSDPHLGGGTDDTAAIQAAINSVTSNGDQLHVVRIPSDAACLVAGTLTVPYGVAIVGHGPWKGKLNFTASVGIQFTTANSSFGYPPIVADLALFNPNGTCIDTGGISGGIISNVWTGGSTAVTINGTPGGSCADIFIRHLVCDGGSQGITFTAGVHNNNIVIENCYFAGMTGNSITIADGRNIRINNCIFRGNQTTNIACAGSTLGYSQNIQITNCQFDNIVGFSANANHTDVSIFDSPLDVLIANNQMNGGNTANIQIAGGTGILISGNQIHDMNAANPAIVITGGDKIKIKGNQIHDLKGQAINSNNANHNLEIENNHIWNVNNTSLTGSNGASIFLGFGQTVRVTGNTIEGTTHTYGLYDNGQIAALILDETNTVIGATVASFNIGSAINNSAFPGTVSIGGGTALSTSNHTGSGNLVLATSPTLSTPTADKVTLTAVAPTVSAGQVGLGSTTATTATAGAQTLPANPAGFLIINVAGTTQKIPYYNN